MMQNEKYKELKKYMIRFSKHTNQAWLGTPIPIIGSKKKDLKPNVNAVGSRFGCHLCNTHVQGDKEQPWSSDHIPPTDWHAKNKWDVLGLKERVTKLYPVCDECHDIQKTLVKDINNLTSEEEVRKYIKSLNDDRHGNRKVKLLKGGQGKYQIAGGLMHLSGERVGSRKGEEEILMEKVSPTERKITKEFGKCHACGSEYAAHKYEVDHVPSNQMVKGHSKRVYKELFHEDVPEQVLYPICPRCSRAQGGPSKRLGTLLKAYCSEHNIPVLQGRENS